MRNIRKRFQTPTFLRSARPNLQRSALGPKCKFRLCNMHIFRCQWRCSLVQTAFPLSRSLGRIVMLLRFWLGLLPLEACLKVGFFVSMGGVRVRPLALTRVCGGPNKFRNGDANWSPEAAWGQEAAIHAKRAHPKPSAPVVFASKICKTSWFWLAESTSSNATKHHIIVTHNVFEMLQ